jgi:hypothetical protein
LNFDGMEEVVWREEDKIGGNFGSTRFLLLGAATVGWSNGRMR